MSLTWFCLVSSWAVAAGNTDTSAAVEIRPAAIVLNAPPEQETEQSCVLRPKAGVKMRIVSVGVTDPAIRLTFREYPPAGTWVVTARIPAGYTTPAIGGVSDSDPVASSPSAAPGDDCTLKWPSQPSAARTTGSLSPWPSPLKGEGVGTQSRPASADSPVEILVKADLTAEPATRPAGPHRGEVAGRSTLSTSPTRSTLPTLPYEGCERVIRIPVRVYPAAPPYQGWLRQPRALVGKLAPSVTVDRLDGGDLPIGVPPGGVTMLVFSAHWCGHCDRHMPVIRRIWNDFAGRGVQLVVVNTSGGNGVGIARAFDRWGFDRTKTAGTSTQPVSDVMPRPPGLGQTDPTDSGASSGSQEGDPGAKAGETGIPVVVRSGSESAPTPVLAVDRGFRASRLYGVKAFPVVFLVGPDGTIQAMHGRWSNHDSDNGLDNLEFELRAELDILISGGTRAAIPDWEALRASPAPAHRRAKATTRPTAIMRPSAAARASNLK